MTNQKKMSVRLLIKSYSITGVMGFIFNCCQSVLSQLMFGLTGMFIFDVLMKDSSKTVFAIAAVAGITVYFIFGIPLWGYWMERCVNTYQKNLSEHVMERFFTAPAENLEKRHSSHYISLLQEDTETTAQLAGWNLVVLIQAVISGVVAVVAFGRISAEILILLVLLGFIPLFTDSRCMKIIRSKSETIRMLTEQRLKCIIDAVNNIIIVKIFGLTKRSKQEIAGYSGKINETEKSINRLENAVNAVDDFIYSGLYKLVVVIMGLQLLKEGRITFGSIIFMLSMVEGISFCMGYIGTYIKQLQKVLVSKHRLEAYEKQCAEQEKKQMEAPAAAEALGGISRIEMENLTFAYPDTGNKIFSDMNLKLLFPNHYILLGENGCGKSTVMKLLFGLYQPSAGKILVNGEEYHGAAGVAEQFAYVPQQVTVYSDTVYENLLLGKTNVTEQEIEAAIAASCLTKWLAGLPQGLHTYIREKGKDMSKGQKMRMAIARALLCKPQILFMDEIDANLDPNTLTLILQNIKKHYSGCSIVTITHRETEAVYEDFKRILIG